EKGGWAVNLVATMFYPLTWLARRVDRGTDRLPAQGPALLVFNHVSHLDPAMDAVFVHRYKRVPRILAKASLFKVPIFGTAIRNAEAIPVYRGSAEAGESLRAAVTALGKDKLVMLYPEGTITKDPDGWPMRPR